MPAETHSTHEPVGADEVFAIVRTHLAEILEIDDDTLKLYCCVNNRGREPRLVRQTSIKPGSEQSLPGFSFLQRSAGRLPASSV